MFWIKKPKFSSKDAKKSQNFINYVSDRAFLMRSSFRTLSKSKIAFRLIKAAGRKKKSRTFELDEEKMTLSTLN